MYNATIVIEKFKNRIANPQYAKRGRLLLSGTALLSLLVASFYSCYKATLVQIHNGDQFVSTAIFSPMYRGGEPMIASGHTNIIKIPLLWLQGVLPQGVPLYAITNIVLVFVSFVLWSYLISRVLGIKHMPILLLTFTAVLVNSPELAVNLSMVTIRHIEYPFALLIALGFLKLPEVMRQKKLPFSATLGSLLGLAIINDHYFLYTLILPIIIVLIYRARQKGFQRAALRESIAALGVGLTLAFIFSKLLSISGLISIVPGYAEGNKIISIGNLFPSILLTLQQTLELFGALIFGQEIRKINISIVLMFMIFLISLATILKTVKRLRKPTDSDEIHIFLLSSLLFAYSAYILPGFASPSASRYLTLTTFIYVTYFAIFIIKISKRVPQFYLAAIVLLLLSTVLAIPRVERYYDGLAVQVNRDRARTQETVSVLESYKIKTVVAGGGHFSLWFESGGKIPITQLENDCASPKKWANNSEWLRPNTATNMSAFLVDTTYPEQASNQCSIKAVESIYGTPSRINPIAKPGEAAKDISTYLLVYDYDIRTKLNLNEVPR